MWWRHSLQCNFASIISTVHIVEPFSNLFYEAVASRKLAILLEAHHLKAHIRWHLSSVGHVFCKALLSVSWGIDALNELLCAAFPSANDKLLVCRYDGFDKRIHRWNKCVTKNKSNEEQSPNLKQLERILVILLKVFDDSLQINSLQLYICLTKLY